MMVFVNVLLIMLGSILLADFVGKQDALSKIISAILLVLCVGVFLKVNNLL